MSKSADVVIGPNTCAEQLLHLEVGLNKCRTLVRLKSFAYGIWVQHRVRIHLTKVCTILSKSLRPVNLHHTTKHRQDWRGLWAQKRTDQIKIDITDVEVGKTLLKHILYTAMICTRKFSGYKQLLVRNSAFTDGLPRANLKQNFNQIYKLTHLSYIFFILIAKRLRGDIWACQLLHQCWSINQVLAVSILR